jgi:serine O-acetyltransferase
MTSAAKLVGDGSDDADRGDLHGRRPHAPSSGGVDDPAEVAPVTAPRFKDAVRGDLARMAAMKHTRYPSLYGIVDILGLPGTWAVLLFRVSAALHHSGLRPLSRIVYFLNSVLFAVDLNPTGVVQPGLALPHPHGVGFGDVRIGRNVVLMGGVRLGNGATGNKSRDGWPTIGDDCYLLDGAKLFGPVSVGHDTVVGTNAVVVRDLPPNVVAMGHPARVIRHRVTGEAVDAAAEATPGPAGR